MVRRALLPAALLLLLGAASAAPSHLGPPESAVALSARAGVGGMARPGRWLPVDITVSGGVQDTHGVLRVEWGDAVALRDIDNVGGDEQHVTVLLRAIAAGPAVHVTITGDGTSIADVSIDVPVELAPLEAPLTLCIGDVESPSCAIRIADDAAPTTWRGFDIADTVLWPTADQSIRHDATRALATWRAMRWLGDAGPADPVLPPFDTRTPAISAVTIRLAMFAVAAVLLTGLAAWRRAHVALTLGIPLIAGVAVVFMLTTPILGQRDVPSLQMTGVVHQFAETPQATFFAKASLEHSSAVPLWLRPDVTDATLTTNGEDAVRSISITDRNGHALYRATAGLGAQRRLTLDGTIDTAWLDVTAASAALTVVNHAPFALSDCMWRGATKESIGTLPPATRVTMTPGHSPTSGDTIVCALPSDWLTWASSTTRIDVRGQQYFVFHFWPAPQDASHAAR